MTCLLFQNANFDLSGQLLPCNCSLKTANKKTKLTLFFRVILHRKCFLKSKTNMKISFDLLNYLVHHWWFLHEEPWDRFCETQPVKSKVQPNISLFDLALNPHFTSRYLTQHQPKCSKKFIARNIFSTAKQKNRPWPLGLLTSLHVLFVAPTQK